MVLLVVKRGNLPLLAPVQCAEILTRVVGFGSMRA